MRGFFAALVVVAALFVPYAESASAADDVDLDTSLLNAVELPVTDSPVLISAAVNNSGTTTGTNVAVNVSIPSGASVVFVSDNCSASAVVVTCTIGSLAPGEGRGANVYLTFGATGTYTVTANAHADQPDTDAESSDRIDVSVGDEDADLAGRSQSARVLVGTEPTFLVANDFTNLGPTAVGGATVSGTVTGGATIVPGSFNFFRDFFGAPVNLADEQCTVTATTFTCTPVFSGGVFEVPQPFVFYDVTLPTTPGTVVAAATLTGRGDANHANDTSTFTIDVGEPAAEVFAHIVAVPGAIPSGAPFLVEGPVTNVGELDAQDVVAVLEAPADWGIAVPPGPLPPGTACSVIASPHAMRCTRSTLPAGESWSVDALVTPPAGTGTGTVSLAVSTVTPETGVHPNNASTTIQFAPGGQTRTLTITPESGLADGDVVTLSGSGFTPNETIYFCEAVVTGMAPQPGDCGVPIQTTIADQGGAFSVAVTVERFLVVRDVGVIDCAQPDATCGVGAADFFAPGGSIVVESMTFTPQPPVDDPLGARIAGSVTAANGAPVPGATVYAYRATDGWLPSLQTTADASGNYVLEDAEAGFGYRIRYGTPSGSDLVAEWYGGAGSDGVQSRSSSVDVRLSAAQPVVDADAELAPGGSLTGTVVGPGGVPVANAIVWAYRGEDRWVGTYATETASDGSYRIRGVQPGTELSVLFAPATGAGLVGEWFDDSPRRRDASPVVVVAGESTHVSAELAAGP